MVIKPPCCPRRVYAWGDTPGASYIPILSFRIIGCHIVARSLIMNVWMPVFIPILSVLSWQTHSFRHQDNAEFDTSLVVDHIPLSSSVSSQDKHRSWEITMSWYAEVGQVLHFHESQVKNVSIVRGHYIAKLSDTYTARRYWPYVDRVLWGANEWCAEKI